MPEKIYEYSREDQRKFYRLVRYYANREDGGQKEYKNYVKVVRFLLPDGINLIRKQCKNLDEMNEFYNYLKNQFTNLEGAKVWIRKWAIEMNQEVPKFGGFSLRAMVMHISSVLEGKDFEISDVRSYIDTKYGGDLYMATFFRSVEVE